MTASRWNPPHGAVAGTGLSPLKFRDIGFGAEGMA